MLSQSADQPWDVACHQTHPTNEGGYPPIRNAKPTRISAVPTIRMKNAAQAGRDSRGGVSTLGTQSLRHCMSALFIADGGSDISFTEEEVNVMLDALEEMEPLKEMNGKKLQKSIKKATVEFLEVANLFDVNLHL